MSADDAEKFNNDPGWAQRGLVVTPLSIKRHSFAALTNLSGSNRLLSLDLGYSRWILIQINNELRGWKNSFDGLLEVWSSFAATKNEEAYKRQTYHRDQIKINHPPRFLFRHKPRSS